MFKEFRPAAGATASTPEVWAATFETSGRLGWYHRLVFRLDHRWRLIRRFVRRGARVLDAGCGAGEWVAFLNEQGYDAEGLDYSSALIARTQATYPHLRWKAGTVQAMPDDDASLDAVISWGVIEHDEAGPDGALAEFHRVLRDGGVAIVTVPVDSERQRQASRAQFPERGDRPQAFFQYFMQTRELEDYLRRAGFDIVESGLQRSIAITLLMPERTAKLTLWQRHLVNRAARLTLWWHSGLRNMAYCVGRKSGARTR